MPFWNLWAASEKYPLPAEKKQKRLVFVECGEPAESASDKDRSR